jgi:hypothetical protein
VRAFLYHKTQAFALCLACVHVRRAFDTRMRHSLQNSNESAFRESAFRESAAFRESSYRDRTVFSRTVEQWAANTSTDDPTGSPPRAGGVPSSTSTPMSAEPTGRPSYRGDMRTGGAADAMDQPLLEERVQNVSFSRSREGEVLLIRAQVGRWTSEIALPSERTSTSSFASASAAIVFLTDQHSHRFAAPAVERFVQSAARSSGSTASQSPPYRGPKTPPAHTTATAAAAAFAVADVATRVQRDDSGASPSGATPAAGPLEHRAQNNDVLDGAGAADLGALTGTVRTVIEESLSDLRLQVHRDVQSMHVDLIRQFQIQKVDPTSTTLRINPSVPLQPPPAPLQAPHAPLHSPPAFTSTT